MALTPMIGEGNSASHTRLHPRRRIRVHGLMAQYLYLLILP